MAKYRKKSGSGEVVEAVQWYRDNELLTWVGAGICCNCLCSMDEHAQLDGGHVCPGDWIITKENGERCKCAVGDFSEEYEPVKYNATADLVAKIETQEKLIANLVAEKVTLLSTIEKQNEHEEKVTHRIAEAADICKVWKQDFEKRNDDLKRENDALAIEINALKNSAGELSDDSSIALSRAREEGRASMERQVMAKVNRIIVLDNDLDMARKQIETLQKCAPADVQAKEIKSLTAQLEKKNQRVDDLQDRAEGCKLVYNNLQEAFDGKVETAKHLNVSVERLNSVVTKLKAILRQV